MLASALLSEGSNDVGNDDNLDTPATLACVIGISNPKYTPATPVRGSTAALWTPYCAQSCTNYHQERADPAWLSALWGNNQCGSGQKPSPVAGIKKKSSGGYE